MYKGVKFRIYPTVAQKKLIEQTFGCCRLVYNYGLNMRETAFKKGDKISYTQTSAELTSLKKTAFPFLKKVDSIALQQSLRDLDKSYTNFFSKRASHPTFKSKHNNNQSYRTINQGNNIRIVEKHIKLPKIGFVRVRQSMDIGKINSATVKRTPTGKYFVVLLVEFTPEPRPNNGGKVGIDVGITDFYTDNNGNKVSNPKYLEKSLKKLACEQRKLARKTKGSSNRNKQRLKVALLHEKVTNQRNDFLHKQSNKLIRENQTICIEDLKVKNLMRNHKLAKHIGSASWSKFFDILTYKAEWYGNDIVKVPTMYASSQLCSCCGHKNPLVKNLAIRAWECPSCHTKHDRDTNAGVNILNKGLQILSV